jgi:hypothetical protein
MKYCKKYKKVKKNKVKRMKRENNQVIRLINNNKQAWKKKC